MKMFGRLIARTAVRELTKEEIGTVAGGDDPCEVRYDPTMHTTCQTVDGVTRCWDWEETDISYVC
jgi:hypothetical protein